jgi:hypothetical protein
MGGLICIMFSVGGVVLLGLSGSSGYYWIVSFFILGGANVCVFMCVVSLAKTMPEQAPLFVSLCIGMFDFSAIIFFTFDKIYQGTSLSFESICLGYAALAALCGICVVRYLPPKDAVSGIQDDFDAFVREDSAMARPDAARNSTRKSEPAKPRASETVTSLACAPTYILLTLMMTIFNLKNTFFVATFSEQLQALVDDEKSDVTEGGQKFLNELFNIVFPIGGAMVVPFSGWFLQKYRYMDDYGFWLVLLLGLGHGVANLSSNLWGQAASIVVFSILRSLKWTVFTDFVNKTYEMKFLGRLLGMGNFFVSTIGLLVYPAIQVAEPSHINPGKAWDRFVLVNAALTVLECVCICFPLYLTRKRWKEAAAASGIRGSGAPMRSPLLAEFE